MPDTAPSEKAFTPHHPRPTRFTKIIVGEQPLSYFDTVVAQWKSSGGDVTTKAVNRVYGKK